MIWEIHGDNRSGKGLLEALFAWHGYNDGRTIYCNCPLNPITEEYDHILNFPHLDYNPAGMFNYNLKDCVVITDEGEIYMDSAFRTKAVRNMYLFGYQARKRGIDWYYTTVRIKNIELRIRLNPDFALETIRFPKDYRKPLIAVKVIVTPRYGKKDHTIWLRHPERFFPLYNHEVMVIPPVETVKAITPMPSVGLLQ